MDEQQPLIPEPEVFTRYKAGEHLDPNEHMELHSYLLMRCLAEIEHVCNNTQMQMAAMGEVLEKVGD
jgi:hypothetical protein